MKQIYRLVDGIAVDIQELRDSKPVPDGFLINDDKDHTQAALSDPIAFTKRNEKNEAGRELHALKQEAIEHFMKGEPMPKNKSDRVKVLEEKMK